MKRIFALTLLLAGCATVFAQYMPTRKGTVMTFESKNLVDNKSVQYTSTVDEVTTDADGKTLVTLVDKHAVEGSLFGEIEEKSFFSYDPSTKLTVNTLATAEEFKKQTVASIREMIAESGQFVSQDDLQQLEDAIKPKGDVTIPLPAEVTDGQTFPNSTIRASLMGQTMGIKVTKGSYLGYEEIEVPAGKFNCLKVTFTFTIIGQGADTKITSWYAPEVGIVKQSITDKKGKALGEDVLLSISTPQ